MACSTFDGMSDRSELTVAGRCAMCCIRKAMLVGPWNGVCPVNSSNSTQAVLY